MNRQYTETALLEEVYNSIKPKEQIWSEVDIQRLLGIKCILSEARIGITSKLKMRISVGLNVGANKHFYVSILSERDSEGNIPISYIKFESASYAEINYTYYSEKNHKMSADQKRELDRFLREKVNGFDVTNWEFAIAVWNSNNPDWELDPNLIQPDYNNLPLE